MYDISDEKDEELPDFSYLLSSCASHSSNHLILKSDKEKFQNSESALNTSKYFNVDINLLNSSIKSIPFNEIQDIKGIEWTEEEITQMNEIAKVNEEIYKSLLANSYLKQNQIAENSQVEKLSKKIDDHLKLPSVKKVDQEKAVELKDGENKESMEKWLDDVLDL